MSLKKIIVFCLAFVLFYTVSVFALPDVFIKGTHNTVETLDPHKIIASSTMEIPYNVYNSLLSYDLDTGSIVPSLATEVPSYENGLIVTEDDGTTYIEFPIRAGVEFHNGSLLKPEDVVYSMKRAIIIVGEAELIGMLASSLLNVSSFSDLVEEMGYDAAYNRLDEAIQVKDNSVVFKLPEPFIPFLSIMADGGGIMAVLNQEWCAAQGDWPGTKESGEDFINLPTERSALHTRMMGTGPFKFLSWEPGERVVLQRFDDYWEGPAQLRQIIRRVVPDTGTAILMLLRGDVDWVYLDSAADLPMVEGYPGVTVVKDLPTNWLMKMNFVFDIRREGNQYIGNGQLGPNGIPPDFFTDINVRKAFQYAFDFDVYINDVFLGSALQPYGPVLVGYPTANPDNPQYYYDPEKAIEYFKKAWNGEVWENGFRVTIPYSAGSFHRQRALEILKANIEALNPKFRIDLASLPWPAYLAAVKEKTLPISLLGMLPVDPDPFIPLHQHMHSGGSYAQDSGYVDLAKEKYDHLIDELGRTSDEERRREISHQLQLYSYEDCHSIFHFQAVGHVAMRDNVRGFKPLPSPFNLNFYTLYKD